MKVMNKLITRIKAWLNDKSYRKKYRYYYLLTFAIPIAVVLIFNMLTQYVVKNQVVVSSEKILNQFFNVLDERFNAVVEDAHAIAKEESLRIYARLSAQESEKRFYIRLPIKDMLNDYNINNVYEDVLVYFAFDDYVISGAFNKVGGTKSIREYARAGYTEDENFLTAFEEIVKCESIVPQFKTIRTETEEYLCVSVKQRLTKDISQNYTVTLMMDKRFWDSQIGEKVLEKGENVILFDEDGSILFSYNNKPVMEELAEKYRRSGIYEVEMNGQNYTILVQKSDVMKGYYVMEISHEIFFKPLSVIRSISFVSIILSIIIGIGVSLKMNQKTYSPIEMAVAIYQDKTKEKFDASIHNEFEFMIESLRKKDEEKERIHRRKREDEELSRKKEFLLAVLEGKEMNDDEMEMLEKQVTCSQRLFGGVMQLETCGKAGWDLISFIVNNVFGELVGEKCQCDILSVSGMRHIFILSLKEEEQEEEVIALFREGILFLRQRFGVEAVLGMGNTCNGLYDLRNMYREAQKALEYRFLLKEDVVIRYRDIQGRHMGNSVYENNPMFHMVKDFLKKEKTDEKSAHVFLDHLVNEYGINAGASIEDVENFRREMLSVLNRIWMNYDLEYFQRNAYITQLEEAEYLDEYLKILATILYETGKETQDNENRKFLVQQIKRYVEENFASPDLNVNSVGKEIGLQAAYLSKIFREEYGVLLINYISLVRINYAKKLLKETRMTLEEIAENTGFLSVNVFINNFKKITNVTPGKYRTASRSVGIEEGKADDI